MIGHTERAPTAICPCPCHNSRPIPFGYVSSWNDIKRDSLHYHLILSNQARATIDGLDPLFRKLEETLMEIAEAFGSARRI